MSTPPKPRQLARDARGRVGEVMPPAIEAHLRDPKLPMHVNLRPPGGGLEWSVAEEELEYLEPEL